MHTLTGLEQMHQLIASGKRPGIAVSLDFNMVDIRKVRCL